MEMDIKEIRARLAEMTRQRRRREVEKGTGLPYSYLRQVEKGLIDNPGFIQMDAMRKFFNAQDAARLVQIDEFLGELRDVLTHAERERLAAAMEAGPQELMREIEALETTTDVRAQLLMAAQAASPLEKDVA